MRASPRRLALAWLAMLLLFGLSLRSSYLKLGSGNLIAELLIAAAQITIVLGLFMKLPRAPALAWIFVGAGLFWLAILFGMTSVDYATRGGIVGY